MRHKDVEIRLDLIRHAESQANLHPDLVGGRNLPTPLTPLGERQADALGRRLAEDGVEYDALFVSPAVRTRKTAEGILRHIGCDKIIVVDDLVEISQGDWEGQPRAGLYADAARRAMAEKHFDFAAPGGESIRMVQRRAANWLEDNVLDNPSVLAAGGGRFGLVSHGITIKSLIQYALNSERSLTWRFQVDNTGLTRFLLDGRGWWPLCINDTAHLRGL